MHTFMHAQVYRGTYIFFNIIYCEIRQTWTAVWLPAYERPLFVLYVSFRTEMSMMPEKDNRAFD